ncbi:hypothetical protein K0M31_014461 [Melipona bicolor]|uniref:Uncharacterized protein n=1 Tax=Melipona bicolor TaxID=60889 RepID=A0AA40G8L4_9HYME|nr:hypothetical protein K0M31_014461 [Melipona bicolor]
MCGTEINLFGTRSNQTGIGQVFECLRGGVKEEYVAIQRVLKRLRSRNKILENVSPSSVAQPKLLKPLWQITSQSNKRQSEENTVARYKPVLRLPRREIKQTTIAVLFAKVDKTLEIKHRQRSHQRLLKRTYERSRERNAAELDDNGKRNGETERRNVVLAPARSANL